MRLVAMVAALCWTAAAGAQPFAPGFESQVTCAPADQFDPAISGDVVVYTDFSGVDADVWFTDLATGVAAPVSTSPGDQQLTGVSGTRIVYTDWNTMDVFVYDVATGGRQNLTNGAGSNSLDPAIGGDLVAWTDDRDGNAEIYARDLRSGEERRLTADLLVDQSAAVHGSLVVWERCDGYACDVWVYDWATGITRQLTDTPWAAERFPDVHGRTVVFQREQGTPVDKNIVAIDLDRDGETVLDLAGDQENAHVSGALVAFNDSASGVPHIGLWDLSTGVHYQVTAGAGGQYLNDIAGRRIVWSDNRAGTLDIWMFEVGLFEPPVADAGSDRSVYVGDGVALTGSAVDPAGLPIVSWQWSVASAPEGATWQLTGADSPAATFTPGAPGEYALALQVSNGQRTSAPDVVTVHASAWLPPVAVATADRTGGSAPLTVCFDASASHSPQPGEPLTYAWDFGDGATSPAAAVCHVFAASPEPYLVTVMVTDGHALTDAETFSVTATEPNRPPAASPSATPAMGAAPLAVSFRSNASDPDGDALSYAWSFGDPASGDDTSTLPDPTHVYRSPGTFTAWLTVSDGSVSVSRSVTVVVNPDGDLSVLLASVKWFKKGVTGKAFLWADFSAPLPGPDDLVMVSLDGNALFARPFSAFRYERDTGAWVLRPSNGSLVRLHFGAGRLLVFTPEKVVLNRLDSGDGVDVELVIGSSVAVERIDMKRVGPSFLVYRSGRCDREPDPARD
jgi:beta propeller repeat protein